jgi:hypothetical protein
MVTLMMEQQISFDARIQLPIGVIVQGPPLSGKTEFTMRLIENAKRIFDRSFDYIYFFYGQRNKTVEEIEADETKRIIAVQGLPEDMDEFIHPLHNNGERKFGLLVFDDLMQNVSNSKTLTELTSKKCQHQSVSWIILMQNMFYQGSERITLQRCAHVYVLFQSPLDKSTARHLGSRIMPANLRVFMDIYEKATSKPNGYLFIDGTQNSREEIRFRTDIFGEYQRIFVPKKMYTSSKIILQKT